MKKLELKHLAPYLPFGLRVYDEFMSNRQGIPYITPMVSYNRTVSLLNGKNIDEVCGIEIKPILRPLSDLTKEITVNGETFAPIDFFDLYEEGNFEYTDMKTYLLIDSIAKHNIIHDVKWLPFGVVEKLLSWHFDVYGLIKDGLAVDINTLNK